MKILYYSSESFGKAEFQARCERKGIEVDFTSNQLNATTAHKADGYDVVCTFANDDLSEAVIWALPASVRLIAIRAAGYDNVDLVAAQAAGIRVCRVPAYSPYAVAEHATALLLGVNRKLHVTNAKVHSNVFTLDGLLGFDIYGKTVGIVATGKIGMCFARIMAGFGAKLIAYDQYESSAFVDLGGEFVTLEEVYQRSDIISLHCPLNSATRHLIDDAAIAQMKPGVVLINTARGAVVDTAAICRGLASGQVGAYGADVVENERGTFFNEVPEVAVPDEIRNLRGFTNALISPHQAFYTREALDQIVETTITNIEIFFGLIPGKVNFNEVCYVS